MSREIVADFIRKASAWDTPIFDEIVSRKIRKHFRRGDYTDWRAAYLYLSRMRRILRLS